MLAAAGFSLWFAAGNERSGEVDVFRAEALPEDAAFVVKEVDALVAQVASSGLVLGDELLGLMEKAASSLPATLTPAQHRRLYQLVSWSLPGDEGERLATLLMRYLDYHQQVAVIRSEYAGAHRQVLESQQALQQHIFGAATAQALFGNRNQALRATLEAIDANQ